VTGRRLNRQIVLAERPVGMVTESCFETVARDVPDLGDGDALLEIRYVGIDPTIRGWLDERGNYMAGVAIGEPVRSNGVGVVVETNNPDEYPLGAAFMHLTGWQQYCVVQANPFPPITMVPAGTDLIDVLSVLGHIGITAYVGVLEVAKPQSGETFCVSAAAGSVGSVAGQIAKMQGARVIGIAGSAEKCEWVTSELGFDACVDYKRDDVAARLKELAPHGVDIFFDNVGGELLDTVLRRIAMRARIVLCGDISTYNSGGRATPLHNIRYVMGKRARMEGFNTLDHWDQYAAAAAQLARWVADGKLVHRAHVLDGLERAPEALVRLFSGDHLGKLVVKVSSDDSPRSRV
jgi:NADPH-dependent curcumin reductase CurA